MFLAEGSLGANALETPLYAFLYYAEKFREHFGDWTNRRDGRDCMSWLVAVFRDHLPRENSEHQGHVLGSRSLGTKRACGDHS